MAKGKKTSIENVYKIMVGYASNKNIDDLARTLDMPSTTVRKVIRDNKEKPEFVELCSKKADEFVNKASKIIDLGTSLLEKRLKTALEKAEEIDLTIDYISNLDDEDMKYKEKLSTIKQLSRLQLNSLSEITTAVGTMYDKRALAKGESTTNETLTIKMSDEVKELSK